MATQGDSGGHAPNSPTVDLRPESQTPASAPHVIVGDGTGIRVSWGNFVTNLPEASHVASVGPHAARFGVRLDFHKEAATYFALEGIDRGERVVMIGSRWQNRDIIRGLEDLAFRANPSAWRDRDLVFLEANELLSELLADDMPDEMEFASFIERARETAGEVRRIRVWNNLGARLHESGRRRASGAIERLWHQARWPLRVTILCSYPLPDDDSKATLADLNEPLQSHSHLIRPCRGGVAVERLQRRAATVRSPANFGDDQQPRWPSGL